MNGNTVLDGEAICARIREFRNWLKWKQEDLSERSGLSQYRISRLETMKSTIEFDEVVAVATAFGMTVDQFTDPEVNEVLLDVIDINRKAKSE